MIKASIRRLAAWLVLPAVACAWQPSSRVFFVTAPVESDAPSPNRSLPEKKLNRKGAQLNPSILMFHKPRHTKGVESIRRAAALGSRRVNVVVTLLCEINKDRKVISYGVMQNGKYVRLNERLLSSFRDALSEVFAEAVAHDMELSILAHLNSGGKIYDWRNNFHFDPLAKYQDYSYQQAVIAPIADALKATVAPERKVAFSLAGEMGTSVFSFPASYSKLLEQLRQDVQLPNLRLGMSFNFSSVAGDDEVGLEERREIQQFVNACDFIGMSNYRWFDLPIETDDFAEAVQQFLAEMTSHGASLPAGMPLHFSEVGIGGGKEEGLAQTPLEASKTPWNGTDQASENPWLRPEMRKFRVKFHRTLLQFLAKPEITNPVTEAYLWSEGSWDPMDITDRGFADPEIIALIQAHNDDQN